MKTENLTFLAIPLVTLLAGCAEFNDPYGSSYDPYSRGGYHDDDYYRRKDWDHRERHQLERERDRLENERRRIEEERRREQWDRQPTSGWAAPAPRQEHCPSGYSPSEQKCSPEERRRGCKDIRLNSGLGCVHR